MVLTPSVMKLHAGDSAPGFSGLPCATCGKAHSLADFSGAKALLVIFMCNHCPYVKGKIEAIKHLHEKYSPNGVVVLGINSNDPADYPEDDFEHMRKEVVHRALGFHYVVDESQAVARAYGATCTPDSFLFDANRKLAYHGRIDNVLEPSAGHKPTIHHVAEAIDALLEGRKPAESFLYSIGCSIKWKVP